MKITDKLHKQPPKPVLGRTDKVGVIFKRKMGVTFARLVCVPTVMSAVLTGCIGNPCSLDTDPMCQPSSASSNSSVSSTSSSSKSSSSKSSSSKVSSSSKLSSSSALSSSSFSSVPSEGNIEKGKAILNGPDCVGCHKPSATEGIFLKLNVNEFTAVNKSAFAPVTESNLAKYITANMPDGDVGACGPQCGQDVAAYLWNLRVTPPETISCNGDSPVLYGQRAAKLLTSYEYQNSLQALFKLPLEKDYASSFADENLEKIPSQRFTVVEDNRYLLFDNNAAEIAAWAMRTPGALPFSCSNYRSESCAQAFIDKFATLAYRRPLTATEQVDYKNMILNGFTPDKGVEWAIRSVLGSAAFLYRTENGVLVSEVRTKGWGTGPANFGGAADITMGVKIQSENYTQMMGVQLEDTMDTGGGKNVGYIDSGDWMDYDVTVSKAGTYPFVFRIAAKDATGAFVVQAKGADVATLSVPVTGGYQNWQDLKKDIALPAGEYTLRIKATGPGFNINWMSVGTPPAEMPALLDVFRVESEAFTAQQGIQLEATMDQEGGQNVGYIDANDTLDYSVTVPTAGEYEVAYRVASMVGGGSFTLEVAGKAQGTLTVPNTGGWQAWQTLKGKATLPEGKTTLRLKAITGGFNINWMEFGRVPVVVTPPATDNFPKLKLADPNAYVLDPYEYASALAYMYTAAPPDITLLRAAAKGDLENTERVDAHIKRMMDSPLGRVQTQRFADKWFKTNRVTQSKAVDPAFTAGVKASMAQEVRELYSHVFYSGVPVTELYSANYSFLDSTLSTFYGIPGGGAMPGQFVQVPTLERGGVITSGAFLAQYSHEDFTSPILRSVHVREDMLCQVMPPIPLLTDDRKALEAHVAKLEEAGNLTTTDKFNLLTQSPLCVSCHENVINPLFAMDDFDHIGLPRKKVGGLVVQKGMGVNGKENLPIDWVNKNRGAVFGVNDIHSADADKLNGKGLYFSGAKDLSNKLANEPAVSSCFMLRSYRFATGFSFSPLSGLKADQIQDRAYTSQQNIDMACQVGALTSKFNASGKSAYEFYRAIGQGDVVRFRKD